MEPIRIFLSTVTADLGGDDREILRHGLTDKHIEVKVQEDFKGQGTDTLEMLDVYIKACDAVVHVIGPHRGSLPVDASVARLLERHPNLFEKCPGLEDALAAEVSYTQWEAWLAIFYDTPLFVVELDGELRNSDAPADQQAAQADHRSRLAKLDRWPEKVESLETLRAEFLRILLTVQSDATSSTGARSSGAPSSNSPKVDVAVGQMSDGARVVEHAEDLGRHAFKQVPLEVLDAAAARTLLEATTGRGPLEEVDALLEHLDGHALGIELAGAYMRRHNESPAGYLSKLQAGEADAGEQRAARSVRYERTVNIALATVWERLDHNVRQAWLTAAQFADAPATIALAEAAGIDAEEIADLRALRLIRSESDDRWTMHRLVRAFGRQAGESDARRDAQQRFLSACVKEAKPIDLVLGFQRYRGDQPHFDRAVNTQPAAFNNASEHSHLLTGIGAALLSAGDYEGAKALSEQALESDLKTYGPQHPNVATDRHNLGRVLQELGDLQGAKAQIEQALESDIKTYGPQHPNVAATRNNLAGVLQDLGDLQGAEAMYEQALESDLKTYGPQHPEVAATRNNLGAVLKDLGHPQGAKVQIEQALESDLKTYGRQHPEVAIRRNNLGAVLKDLGDLQGAKAQIEQALESDLKTYGRQHPEVAIRRNNLGAVLKDLGDLQGAKAQIEQALESDLKTFGPQHPRVATQRNNLAGVLQDLGDLQGAKAQIEQALESDLKTFGSQHPEVAIRRNNLGRVLQDLGDLQGAKAQIEQALESDLKTYGAQHPKVATHRNNLAGVLQALGGLQGAKAMYEQALETDLKTYGPQHPEVATDRHNLAGVLQALGDLQGAKALSEQALESDLKTYGPQHPKVATDRHNLAGVLRALGDLQGAIAQLEQALKIRTQMLGAEHPDTKATRENLEIVERELREQP